ncbi:hypothetical protein CEUSTIGMA_g2669.t1 [Chlamydomonas eustigma]|uniref:DNA 3'-5' helicase n=1 Tax=Chlamydomonas eustigma TaxID=1157962 RepID=A0A250WWQ3_9CHLO|nr:hypothetical protein CEUSTIGMA_g2669.t1 [Chlamydomonas eustigma]|eukprot:GAX75225.1 hypothetical protein CEUSTIGMA_g2669.t1 [Chlamydomonas eustigma]
MKDEQSRGLLKDLLPLLEFQKHFKHQHGRRAQDSEHPESLKPLLIIFKENRDLLLQRSAKPAGHSGPQIRTNILRSTGASDGSTDHALVQRVGHDGMRNTTGSPTYKNVAYGDKCTPNKAIRSKHRKSPNGSGSGGTASSPPFSSSPNELGPTPVSKLKSGRKGYGSSSFLSPGSTKKTGGLICELDVVAGSPWAVGAAAAGSIFSPAKNLALVRAGRLSLPLTCVQQASAADTTAAGSASRMIEVLSLARRGRTAIKPAPSQATRAASVSAQRSLHLPASNKHSGIIRNKPIPSYNSTGSDDDEENIAPSSQLPSSPLFLGRGSAANHSGQKPGSLVPSNSNAAQNSMADAISCASVLGPAILSSSSLQELPLMKPVMTNMISSISPVSDVAAECDEAAGQSPLLKMRKNLFPASSPHSQQKALPCSPWTLMKACSSRGLIPSPSRSYARKISTARMSLSALTSSPARKLIKGSGSGSRAGGRPASSAVMSPGIIQQGLKRAPCSKTQRSWAERSSWQNQDACPAVGDSTAAEGAAVPPAGCWDTLARPHEDPPPHPANNPIKYNKVAGKSDHHYAAVLLLPHQHQGGREFNNTTTLMPALPFGLGEDCKLGKDLTAASSSDMILPPYNIMAANAPSSARTTSCTVDVPYLQRKTMNPSSSGPSTGTTAIIPAARTVLHDVSDVLLGTWLPPEREDGPHNVPLRPVGHGGGSYSLRLYPASSACLPLNPCLPGITAPSVIPPHSPGSDSQPCLPGFSEPQNIAVVVSDEATQLLAVGCHALSKSPGSRGPAVQAATSKVIKRSAAATTARRRLTAPAAAAAAATARRRLAAPAAAAAATARRRLTVPAAAATAPRRSRASVIVATRATTGTNMLFSEDADAVAITTTCSKGLFKEEDSSAAVSDEAGPVVVGRRAPSRAAAMKAKRALSLPASPVVGSPSGHNDPVDSCSGDHALRQDDGVRPVEGVRDEEVEHAAAASGACSRLLVCTAALMSRKQQKAALRSRKQQEAADDVDYVPAAGGVSKLSGRQEPTGVGVEDSLIMDCTSSSISSDYSSEECDSEVKETTKNRKRRGAARREVRVKRKSTADKRTGGGGGSVATTRVSQSTGYASVFPADSALGLQMDTIAAPTMMKSGHPPKASAAACAKKKYACSAAPLDSRRALQESFASRGVAAEAPIPDVAPPVGEAAMMATNAAVVPAGVRSAAAAALGLSCTAAGSRGGRHSTSSSGRGAAPIMGLSAGPRASAGAAGAAAAERRGGAAGGKSAASSVGRMNFVRCQSGGKAKRSFQFQSKSATSGTIKSAAGRRLRRINGKIVSVTYKNRAVSGLGSDHLEGFKAEKRCFRCGEAGHWAQQCPHANGTAADMPGEGEGMGADKSPGGGGRGGGDGVAMSSPIGLAGMPGREPSGILPPCYHPPTAAAAGGVDISALSGSNKGSSGGHSSAPPASGLLLQPSNGAAGNAGSVPGLRHYARNPEPCPIKPRDVFELSRLLLPEVPPELCTQLVSTPGDVTDCQLQMVLKAVFGHDDFRGRQLEVIRSVLKGDPLLAILPTGAGKSLCYQLPAALLPGLVLVVSPLLALMRDQLDRLPEGLPGAMLWGGQTRSEADVVIQDAARGALKLLYIAPEKLLTPVVLQALLRLPQGISLVCVDEAHCVAEWGHSFRPAYFRLGHVLRSVLRPRGVLALTATATRPTEQCIAQVLGLPAESVVRDAPMRENLRLKVLHVNGASQSGQAVKSIVKLLKDGELRDCARVIVYCAYQLQADDAAKTMSVYSIRAASYHAGKPMEKRLQIQKDFADGKVRVVVATVAFGMGVDMSCLGAVIHLTMPRSLEDYVQQVGRAGRDGSEGTCWLVLDNCDHERLRSLSCSNAVEESSVLAFLGKVFKISSDAASNPSAGSSAFGVLSVLETSTELDISEETMETVLSYLQGHDSKGHIAVLPSTSNSVAVTFHVASSSLDQRHPIVTQLAACRPRVTSGVHRVPMAKLVEVSQKSPSQILAELAQLAASYAIHFELSRGKALAWRVISMPQVDQLPALASSLFERLTKQQALNVRRLDIVHAVMATAAKEVDSERQETVLRSHIHTYFNCSVEVPEVPAGCDLPVKEASTLAAGEVAAFLLSNREDILHRSGEDLSATAVARIFHGLATPSYPADQWRKCGFWGKFTKWDFLSLREVARTELQKFYTRNRKRQR